MAEPLNSLVAAVDAVTKAPRQQKRRMIAICGAPASGKSTFADALCQGLLSNGVSACVVPMDGFHLDNVILQAHGTYDRKGAPHTFDSAGFAALINRCAREDDVYYPTFDRARDISIAASGVVSADIDTVLVEGNYLLMKTPGWQNLLPLWDLSIYLDVAAEVLNDRLVTRWVDHGLAPDAAAKRADQNDMRNARTVIDQSAAADFNFLQ
ncbi:MAG: nucleoside/nucleotide kinase family protein [Sulfitobacter sp.]